MIPTWTYVKSADGLYVNLFIGSTTKVDRVAGTDVEMVQKTDYPWNGKVAITVNPQAAKTFTLHIRVPDRATSGLYKESPAVTGLKSFAVNGQPASANQEWLRRRVTREWHTGDNIAFEVPMEVQRLVADERVRADNGMVCLRYGPLIYSFESVDNGSLSKVLAGNSPLSTSMSPTSSMPSAMLRKALPSSRGRLPRWFRPRRHPVLRPPESHAQPDAGRQPCPAGPGRGRGGAGRFGQSQVWIRAE